MKKTYWTCPVNDHVHYTERWRMWADLPRMIYCVTKGRIKRKFFPESVR